MEFFNLIILLQGHEAPKTVKKKKSGKRKSGWST